MTAVAVQSLPPGVVRDSAVLGGQSVSLLWGGAGRSVVFLHDLFAMPPHEKMAALVSALSALAGLFPAEPGPDMILAMAREEAPFARFAWQPYQYLDQVEYAEELGFDSVCINEHGVMPHFARSGQQAVPVA